MVMKVDSGQRCMPPWRCRSSNLSCSQGEARCSEYSESSLPLRRLLTFGNDPRSCPFSPDGPWENGVILRDGVYSASASLVGATGALGMAVGDGETDGAEADGREASTATFCAVNLRPHSTRGGRFEIIGTLDGQELVNSNSTGFQVTDGRACDTIHAVLRCAVSSSWPSSILLA